MSGSKQIACGKVTWWISKFVFHCWKIRRFQSTNTKSLKIIFIPEVVKNWLDRNRLFRWFFFDFRNSDFSDILKYWHRRNLLAFCTGETKKSRIFQNLLTFLAVTIINAGCFGLFNHRPIWLWPFLGLTRSSPMSHWRPNPFFRKYDIYKNNLITSCHMILISKTLSSYDEQISAFYFATNKYFHDRLSYGLPYVTWPISPRNYVWKSKKVTFGLWV